jgi:hypothetical protein
MARARSRSRGRQVSFKIDRGSDRIEYDRVDVYSSPSKPPSRREVVIEHKSTTRASSKGKGKAKTSDSESMESPSNCGSHDRKSYSRDRTPKPPSRPEVVREPKSTTRPSTKGKGRARAETSDRESSLESPSRREVVREHITPRPSTKGKGKARAETSDRESSLESPLNCGRGQTPKPPSRREVVREHKSISRPPTKGKGKARAETPGSESSLESRDDRKSYSRGQTPGPEIGLPKGIKKRGQDSKRRLKGSALDVAA